MPSQENVFHPAWMEGLTPEMMEKAFLELGETPLVKEKCIAELRNLLENEPDLHPKLDSPYLLRYLRAKKYDVNKAFRTLLNHYHFRARHRGTLTDLRPRDIGEFLSMDFITLLPRRDWDGASVGVLRAAQYDDKLVTAEQAIATALLCTEVALENEATIVCGSVIILDLAGLTFAKTRSFTSPTILKMAIAAFQDCVACRVKGLHVVNEPYYCNVIFNFVKKCLHKKIRQRIFFHGTDLTSLHEHVPPEILPEYLGGTQVLDTQEYRDIIMGKEEYFEENNQYGYPKGYSSKRKISITV